VNWKYLVFDIVKVALPLLLVALLPEGVAQGTVIDAVLYGFAALLGIDSVQKTARSVKNRN
jgi:hypothetical protein